MSGSNDPDQESSVLSDLKHHPRVCSNCFRLRHHQDPIPERIERLAQRTVWASAVLEPRARTPEMAGDAPLLGSTVAENAPRTVCECGAVSAYAAVKREADDPLTKERVIEYAKNISETLVALRAEALERGELTRTRRFHHDRDLLLFLVGHLKEKPGCQFKDDHVLAAATELATEKAT